MDTEHDMQRRQFLTVAGVAGASALTAGCNGLMGEGTEEVVLSTFPTNMPQLAWLDQEGIVQEEFEEEGYELQIDWTFEGPSQFAAGQSDIAVNLSTIDAARMADERDMDIAIAGKLMTMFNGFIARTGSPYAPSEAGGKQAAVDNIVADEATVGIFGWSSGHIPTDQIIFEAYGATFDPDGSDFEVVEAAPGALAELLMDEEIDVAANAPTQGGAPHIYNGDAEGLWYGSDELAQQEFGVAPLINTVVRPEFVEENPGAIRAWHRAWERGNDWFFEDGLADIPGNDTVMEQYNTGDSEMAEYITEWLIDEGDHIPDSYQTSTPRHWHTADMDDEWLDRNHEFMDNAADVGFAPDNWRDLISYEHVDY